MKKVRLLVLVTFVILGFYSACTSFPNTHCESDADCARDNNFLICFKKSNQCVPQWWIDSLKKPNPSERKQENTGSEEPVEPVTSDEPNSKDESTDEPINDSINDATEPTPENEPPRPETRSEPTPEQRSESKTNDDSCAGSCSLGAQQDCFPKDKIGCSPDGKDCKGICKAGKQACIRGTNGCGEWGECLGTILPTQEVCDNKDNDCDGKLDEVCVVTFAGSGKKGKANGSALQAEFDYPTGMAFDAQGNLYVSDSNNHLIRKIDSKGMVTTFAGTGFAGLTNGKRLFSKFKNPRGLKVDAMGNLYIAEKGNHCIRKIDTQGNVTIFAGTGQQGYKDDMDPKKAQFNGPNDLYFGPNGDLYVADFFGHRIRKIATHGEVSTVTGDGTAAFKEGSAVTSQLNLPSSIILNSRNEVIFSDYFNNRIRRISNATVYTDAGNDTTGFKDGPVAQALIYYPIGLAIDASDAIYFADAFNFRIRKLDKGTISTIAGSSTKGYKDALPLKSQFNEPNFLVIDPFKNLYIADSGNNRIRKFALP